MLDFNKLMRQIDQVGQESLDESLSEHETALHADEAYEQAKEDPARLAERLVENQSSVLWPLAIPLEQFGNVYSVDARRDPVTVVAVDGSQIMPSHHEVHACYLLNVGVAVVTYGIKKTPILESIPHLFHRPEDLYPLVDRRRFHIDELYVSLERTLLELSSLLEHSNQARERGADVVALFDGSLIPWSADKLPDSYKSRFDARLIATLDAFQSARVPLIGYLSSSRSSDVVNDLRVSICPYEQSRCRDLCGHLSEEEFPCSTIWPMSDRHLFRNKLEKGERSPVFLSGATAARSLPQRHRICFTYLNTGFEIARIELPHWLYADGNALKLALRTALTQTEKGKGYPICLAEAHHLAVIRGSDREQFFQLMTRHLIGMGVPRVRVSPKESRKRTGFV